MRNIIVVPVLLILCLLQTNNLLFADENIEAKSALSSAISEASAEVSTAAVAEAIESAEVVVEEAAAEEVAETVEAVAEEVTVAVEEIETVTEEIATIVAETEESTEAVVAEVIAEEVVEKVAEAVTETTVAITEAVVESESDVIATVNGEKILRLSFNKRLNVFRRMNQEVTDVIKMQVVQTLAVNEQVEHVVALATDLQTHFNPVQLGALEELGVPQCPEQVFLVPVLGGTLFELVHHPVFQQLLVADADLDGVPRGAMFLEPTVDQWNVNRSPAPAGTEAKRLWGPVQIDSSASMLGIEGPAGH